MSNINYLVSQQLQETVKYPRPTKTRKILGASKSVGKQLDPRNLGSNLRRRGSGGIGKLAAGAVGLGAAAGLASGLYHHLKSGDVESAGTGLKQAAKNVLSGNSHQPSVQSSPVSGLASGSKEINAPKIPTSKPTFNKPSTTDNPSRIKDMAIGAAGTLGTLGAGYGAKKHFDLEKMKIKQAQQSKSQQPQQNRPQQPQQNQNKRYNPNQRFNKRKNNR